MSEVVSDADQETVKRFTEELRRRLNSSAATAAGIDMATSHIEKATSHLAEERQRQQERFSTSLRTLYKLGEDPFVPVE